MKIIKFYEFESGEICHYKLIFCIDPSEISEIEVEAFATQFEFESAHEFFGNLNFVFLQSMNLNLNFVFSKSMNLNLNLNFIFSKSMNLNLNFIFSKPMNVNLKN